MFSLKSLKRLGVGAALVSALALSGLGATAQAVDAPTGDPASTITEDTGSLTIHKHKQGSTLGDAATGEELKTAPADPLNGVTFKVQKITDVNLKTNDGWKKAEEYATAFKNDPNYFTTGAGASTLDAGTEQTTANGGIATFSNLPVGYYLVTETDNSGAEDASGNPVGGLVGAKPFLVAIPMTKPSTQNEWLYDVHVYPKNQPIEVDKTVTDAGKNVGDEVDYAVTTGIPHVEDGDTISKYVITDVMPDGTGDDGHLTYTADSAAVALKLAEGVTGLEDTDKTLVKDTDYTLTLPTATANKIVVTFTEAGRTKLAKVRRADATATVTLTFKATITDVGTDGTVTNKVYLAPSSEYATEPGDGDTPPPDGDTPPGDEVTSKFGKMKFIKKASDTSNALAGAEFELYHCADLTKKLTIGTTSKWTSDSDGSFTIEGLHASDWINGAEDLTTYYGEGKTPQYCLVEIKAPEGYELLPEPVKFNIDSKKITAYETPLLYTGEDDKGTLTNRPKNGGFDLPLTGSNALILVSAAGACLLAGGAFLLLRGRKDAEA